MLLVVVCDGETEMDFCSQLLKPHLQACGYVDVRARKISKYSYQAFHRDVCQSLLQFKWTKVVVSTMHDLYKLPKNFPEHDLTKLIKANPTPYVEELERAYAEDVNDARFVPYIQLHEFETLLFSDPNAFRPTFEKAEKAIAELEMIVRKAKAIELINDGESTSPSHRIKQLFAGYNKRLHGVEIAKRIGLPKLREKCPHFDQWLTKLEAAVKAG